MSWSPPAPLRESGGTWFVGTTRVPLDSVMARWNEGATPEEVVAAFPSLDLVEVYETVAFALRQPEIVGRYLARRQRSAEEVRDDNAARYDWSAVRARLQKRRAARESASPP